MTDAPEDISHCNAMVRYGKYDYWLPVHKSRGKLFDPAGFEISPPYECMDAPIGEIEAYLKANGLTMYRISK